MPDQNPAPRSKRREVKANHLIQGLDIRDPTLENGLRIEQILARRRVRRIRNEDSE